MSFKWPSVLISFLLLISLSASATRGGGGGMDSGGGSSLAAAFTRLGYRAVKLLKDFPDFPLTSDQFSNLVRSTQVKVTQDPLLDAQGKEVDMLSIPNEKVIWIRYQKWLNLLTVPRVMLHLVVHEYLNIAGIKDPGYELSLGVLRSEGTVKTTVCRHRDDKIKYQFFLTREERKIGSGDTEYEVTWTSSYSLEDGVLRESSPPLRTWADENGELLIFQILLNAYKVYFPSEFLDQDQDEFTVSHSYINFSSPDKIAGELTCKNIIF